MPRESVKQGSAVVQTVIFVKPFLLTLKSLEIIKVLVKMVFRLLLCWVYLKNKFEPKCHNGQYGK